MTRAERDELRRLAENIAAGHYSALRWWNTQRAAKDILALLDERDALERRVAELEAAERLLAMR